MYASRKCFMLETVSLSVVLGTVPSRRQKSGCLDFSEFCVCDHIILVNYHCAMVRLWSMHHTEEACFFFIPKCPFLLLFHIFALSLSLIRPTCDCEQGCDAFKAGRGRVFSITCKCCCRFLWYPPPPQSETPSDEYNEHNLQDVILILYLSAFVCKLSIMEKRKETCMHLFLVLSWDDFA